MTKALVNKRTHVQANILAVCEDAATSPGFVSAYHVVGPVLSAGRLGDWVHGRTVPSAH